VSTHVSSIQTYYRHKEHRATLHYCNTETPVSLKCAVVIAMLYTKTDNILCVLLTVLTKSRPILISIGLHQLRQQLCIAHSCPVWPHEQPTMTKDYLHWSWSGRGWKYFLKQLGYREFCTICDHRSESWGVHTTLSRCFR